MDLPFSIPFYRWLLNEEHSVGLADLSRVAPEVQSTLVRLQDVVHQREMILADTSLDAMEKTEKVCVGRSLIYNGVFLTNSFFLLFLD